jgi:hypothetical protein
MKKFKQTYKRYFESRAEQYILPLIKQHGAYLFFIVKGTTGQSVDETTKASNNEETPTADNSVN